MAKTAIPTSVRQVHGMQLAADLWEVSLRDAQGGFWTGKGASFEDAYDMARRLHAATVAGPTYWPEGPKDRPRA